MATTLATVTDGLANLAAGASAQLAAIKSVAAAAASLPTTAPFLESPSGTLLTGEAGIIVDAQGLVYNLKRVPGSNLVIQVNGLPDTTTNNVIGLRYDAGVIRQTNNQGGWWLRALNGTWVNSANPVAAASPPPTPAPAPAPATPPAVLSAPTGNQVNVNVGTVGGPVPTGLFGLARAMGANSWSYPDASDAAFLAVANAYPTPSLRHNWELTTMMSFVFPSRGASANFGRIDNWLSNRSRFAGWFAPGKPHILTLGYPKWLNPADGGDQALFGQMALQVAQHFDNMSFPLTHIEAMNEPDGHVPIASLTACSIAMARAVKAWKPALKVGGLSYSWYQSGDYSTFVKAMVAAGLPPDFLSFHQYVTGKSGDKSPQQCVTDALGMANTMRAMRSNHAADGLPSWAELIGSEYNIDGGDYTDPMNNSAAGAVAAAGAAILCVKAGVGATVASLWEVCDDSSYGAYGYQGNYAIQPTGRVLSKLGQALVGNVLDTPAGPGVGPVIAVGATANGRATLVLVNPDLGSSHTVSVRGMPNQVQAWALNIANPAGTTFSAGAADLASLSLPAGGVMVLS